MSNTVSMPKIHHPNFPLPNVSTPKFHSPRKVDSQSTDVRDNFNLTAEGVDTFFKNISGTNSVMGSPCSDLSSVGSERASVSSDYSDYSESLALTLNEFTDLICRLDDVRLVIVEYLEKVQEEFQIEQVTHDFAINICESFLNERKKEIQSELEIEVYFNKIILENEPVTFKQLKNVLKGCVRTTIKNYAQLFGIQVVSDSFKFDREFIQLNWNCDKNKIKEVERKIRCFKHILYELDFPPEYWWDKAKFKPFNTKEAFEEFKTKFNYFEINGKPQEDDIIVYLNDLQEPIHVGRFVDSETVHSKWGDMPQVFHHSPDQTLYGTNYVVLRQNVDIS